MVSRGKRLLQRARRAPAFGPLRERSVQAMRNSDVLREVVKRIYSIDVTLPVPLDVAPGKVLGGVGAEALPVAVVLALEADASAFDAAVDDIARLQRASAGYRPVIVTDQPRFASVRRHGYPMELLLPRESWDADDHGMSWDEYARERIALIFATYRASASVTLGPAGLDPGARLLLSSLRPVR
jgi:hypothetical protein